MPISQDSFENNFEFNMNGNSKMNRLDTLKNDLEKYLLSDVRVRKMSLAPGYRDLVVEVDCNFSFSEVLVCIKNDATNTINFSGRLEDHKTTDFFNLLFKIYSECTPGIDIGELVITLKDTTLIIGRIYECSILEQLENIFTSLANHQVSFTKEINEMPYEIYIPVFEENTLQIQNTGFKIINNTIDYFGFWGLYFESEEDAVIYDLEQRRLAWGDLVMLNH